MLVVISVQIPRVHLANLPTPLVEAPRLAAALGGAVRLFIKHDDETGLCLGGNKVRKLEFLLGQARAEGADAVITAGAVQSNHCRLTAAAARRLGMKPFLLLQGTEPGQWQGNLLIDGLLGARVAFVGHCDDAALDGAMAQLGADLRAEGRRPYLIPVGGSNGVGALGYVQAMRELLDQAAAAGVSPDYVFLACGSGGTMGGLELGRRLCGAQVRLVGVSAGRLAAELQGRVSAVAAEAAAVLGQGASGQGAGHSATVPAGEVCIDDSQVGPGYGEMTPAASEAMLQAARREGVVLDPVYTAKAMAGCMDWIKSGRVEAKKTVVFWHTGGVPALFAVPHGGFMGTEP